MDNKNFKLVNELALSLNYSHSLECQKCYDVIVFYYTKYTGTISNLTFVQGIETERRHTQINNLCLSQYAS